MGVLLAAGEILTISLDLGVGTTGCFDTGGDIRDGLAISFLGEDLGGGRTTSSDLGDDLALSLEVDLGDDRTSSFVLQMLCFVLYT